MQRWGHPLLKCLPRLPTTTRSKPQVQVLALSAHRGTVQHPTAKIQPNRTLDIPHYALPWSLPPETVCHPLNSLLEADSRATLLEQLFRYLPPASRCFACCPAQLWRTWRARTKPWHLGTSPSPCMCCAFPIKMPASVFGAL